MGLSLKVQRQFIHWKTIPVEEQMSSQSLDLWASWIHFTTPLESHNWNLIKVVFALLSILWIQSWYNFAHAAAPAKLWYDPINIFMCFLQDLCHEVIIHLRNGSHSGIVCGGLIRQGLWPNGPWRYATVIWNAIWQTKSAVIKPAGSQTRRMKGTANNATILIGAFGTYYASNVWQKAMGIYAQNFSDPLRFHLWIGLDCICLTTTHVLQDILAVLHK